MESAMTAEKESHTTRISPKPLQGASGATVDSVSSRKLVTSSARSASTCLTYLSAALPQNEAPRDTVDLGQPEHHGGDLFRVALGRASVGDEHR